MRSRTALCAVWAASIACLGGAWTAPTAMAGEYPIYACAVPGQEGADEGPWRAYATGDPAFLSMPTTTCGGNAFFGRGDASSMYESYPFAGGFAGYRADVPAGRAIEIRRVQVNGTIGYGLTPDTVGTLRTVIRPGEVGLCSGPQTCDATWQHTAPPGSKTVELGVTCSGGGTCTTAHTYAQRWRWIIITAAESVRPSIAATGGQLLAGGAQRGTRRLAYTATDPDSGVARIQVLLGDRVVGERRLSDDRSSCAHRSWNACPTTTTAELDVDTTRAADGRHTVTVAATDAAGNESTAVAGVVTVDNIAAPSAVEPPAVAGRPVAGQLLTGDAGRWAGATGTPLLRWKRCSASGCEAIPGATGSTYRLTTDDVGSRLVLEAIASNSIGETAAAQSAPTATVTAPAQPAPAPAAAATPAPARPAAPAPTPNGTNATTRAKLVARLANGKATRRIRYGSATTVKGALTDEHGRPIAGAALVVTERVRAAGAAAKATATVTTDAKGAFRYRVKAGPSRELTFGYRARTSDRDFSSTTTVTVLVRSAVRFRATPSRLRNGGRLRFTGVVRGRPRGKTGPLVDLQVVVHGKWRSFLRGAVRADRKGRFKASYRFLRTYWPSTYRFRAVARQDSAYPYLAGRSATRTVKVRP